MGDDYEIVAENCDRTFLVKHRPSGQLFHVQSVSLEKMTEKSRKALMKKINSRVNLVNPLLVQFFTPIQHRETVFLRREHCPLGSLDQFTKNLQKPLHETFLFRILYQTAFALNTIKRPLGPLDRKTVFLDKNYQVKLYNFSTELQGDVKLSHLGSLIFQLATGKDFEKSEFEADLRSAPYSETLKSLLASMIKDPSHVKKHINKILSHPPVLLQASQWNIHRCFLEQGNSLEQREAALQIKEQRLQKQERLLEQRELKLQRKEQTLKDKLLQADAYLKRCAKNQKHEEEPSYISCGDSDPDVFPTSFKLHMEKIAKPPGFSRTLSERRIRFKTSPLKDRNLVRKSLRQPKMIEQQPKHSLQTTQNRRTCLFLPNCENPQGAWTQEAKKHAFEMLRLLNSGGKENVRHTML